MRRGSICVVLLLAFAAFGLPTASAKPKPLPLEIHTCGQAITHSFKLANDMTNCSGDGLDTSGTLHGVTINLNGHRITASNSNTGTGILTQSTDSLVTLTGGMVSGFKNGDVSFASSGTISHMLLTDSGTGTPAILVGADKVTVKSNVITRNPAGIKITTNRNLIKGNVVDGNGGDGIAIVAPAAHEGEVNVITGNEVIGNTSRGIRIDGNGANPPIGNNVITSNKVIGNASTGMFISDAMLTKVLGNVIRGNTVDGLRLDQVGQSSIGNGTNVGANHILANGNDGIDVSSTPGVDTFDQNTIVGNALDGVFDDSSDDFTNNTSNENGSNGFDLTTPGLLQSNVANGNGFANGVDSGTGYGFLLTSGGDASNTAANNSADAQCSPNTSCTAGSSTPPGTLKTCSDLTFSGSFTLHYPMDCPTQGFHLSGTGPFTVDLGDHIFAVDSTDNAVNITGTDITLLGGVLVASSGTGVAVSATGVRASIHRSLIMQSLAAVDTDPSSSSTSVADVITAGDGNSPTMRMDGSSNSIATTEIVAPLGVAVQFGGSNDVIGSRLTDSSIVGGRDTALVLFNASQSTILRNKIIGSAGRGMEIDGAAPGTGSHDGHFTSNVIQGGDVNGIVDQSDGLDTTNSVGDENNKFVNNVIAQNKLEGVLISRDPETTNIFLFGNKITANGGDAGVEFDIEITGVMRKNKLMNNDIDGVYSGLDPLGIVFIENVANHNGFKNGNTDPNTGLGIDNDATVGRGCGNIAKHNEDKDQLLPSKLKKPC